ncbi:hypothetical protein ACR6C2_42100 [Streptomyces sp. INA 01156]
MSKAEEAVPQGGETSWQDLCCAEESTSFHRDMGDPEVTDASLTHVGQTDVEIERGHVTVVVPAVFDQVGTGAFG